LIRGYALSPRLAAAILMVFVHRWNHDLEVRVRGLSKEYADFYKGWIIEGSKRTYTKWVELDNLPFSDFASSGAFADTGERFPIMLKNVTTDLEGPQERDTLADEAQEHAKSIQESEQENLFAENPEELVGEESIRLPASALWMCERMSSDRPMRDVEGPEEEAYFANNFSKFQGGLVRTDKSHSGINFSLFADTWNKKALSDEPEGLHPKNAGHLQKHWTKYKKKLNSVATLKGHQLQRDKLRRQLRASERSAMIHSDSVRPTTSAPPATESAAITTERDHVSVPLFSNTTAEGNPTGDLEHQQEPPSDDDWALDDTGGWDDLEDSQLTATKSVNAPTARVTKALVVKQDQKKPRRPARCRACGHTNLYAKFYLYHPIRVNMQRYCRVPQNEVAPGFPMPLEGKIKTAAWPPPCSCCLPP
jgi:hypothetical protein